MHVAELVQLKASTRYYYVVGDLALGVSAVFSVKTMPDAATLESEEPMVIAVYGEWRSWSTRRRCGDCHESTASDAVALFCFVLFCFLLRIAQAIKATSTGKRSRTFSWKPPSSRWT